MKHYLFVTSWYPTRLQSTHGIFVKNHAIALSHYAKVTVIYVYKGTQNQKFETQVNPNFNEILIEFKAMEYPPTRALYHFYTKRKLYKRHISELVSQELIEQVVVHVPFPMGFLAPFLRKKLKLKYSVLEHWTGYLPEDNAYTGFIKKRITSECIRFADKVITVSKHLAKAMQVRGLQGDYQVLPNVVQEVFFEKRNSIDYIKAHQLVKLIHVSSLDPRQKNVKALIDAVRILVEQDLDVMLTIVGNESEEHELISYASEQNLLVNHINFIGKLNASDLSHELSMNNALVLCSNYENLPVVILEAWAVGIPVISTNVGGIGEWLNKDNGVLIKDTSAQAIANAIIEWKNNHEHFTSDTIKTFAYANFSEKVVGLHFNKLLHG